MSTQEGKRNSFPPLQKRIILHLTENGPQTINETMKGISGHYKSSWIAFHVLKKKGLIKEVTVRNYRGRDYPRFWVTDSGIFIALHEGTEPKTLLRKTLEVYPEDRKLQFLIEAVPILGKNAFDVLYLAALSEGLIEQSDLTSIFAAQMQKKLTPKQIRQFIAVLNKYPEPHQQCKDYIKQTRQNLQELSDLL
jgi:hypothetical protein